MIAGFPLQNWNRYDLSNQLVKFVHVIYVSDETLELLDLQSAKVLVCCESLQAIPAELHAVIGHNLFLISIRVTKYLISPPSGS